MVRRTWTRTGGTIPLAMWVKMEERCCGREAGSFSSLTRATSSMKMSRESACRPGALPRWSDSMCSTMVLGVKDMGAPSEVEEARRARPRRRLLETRRWLCLWFHWYVHSGYSFLRAGKLCLGWFSSV